MPNIQAYKMDIPTAEAALSVSADHWQQIADMAATLSASKQAMEQHLADRARAEGRDRLLADIERRIEFRRVHHQSLVFDFMNLLSQCDGISLAIFADRVTQ